MLPGQVGRFHLACIVNSEAEVKTVVQRVSEARVCVGEEPVGEIGAGVCVLLGVGRGDGGAEAQRLAGKVARLRIFEDQNGRFDRSLLEVRGEALVVSQFTLLADTTSGKGTRPDFSQAAPRDQAEPLYETFCLALRDLGVKVETGAFGERMAVELVNDGPVTIVLEV
jgi:D-tyrosyl-tRNA(Tyr) deacylase